MTAGSREVEKAAAAPAKARKRRYELRVSEEVEVRDLVTGAVVRLSRVLAVQPLPMPS